MIEKMKHEMTGKANIDQSEDELQHREENEYREYICKEIYHNEECGFVIRGKNEDEVIEHAHMHQEVAHGMEKRSPEMDKQIRENIRPLHSTGSKAGTKETGAMGVKSEEGRDVEPIKPGDSRVARRRGSLLDTCYPTSSGSAKPK